MKPKESMRKSFCLATAPIVGRGVGGGRRGRDCVEWRAMADNSRTTIVVALIGMMGVLGAALITATASRKNAGPSGPGGPTAVVRVSGPSGPRNDASGPTGAGPEDP